MKQRAFLTQSFSFLKDWGFEEVALNTYQGEFDDEKNCIINLRSDEYRKQIELMSSGFESISCLVRNIVQHEPAPYFDLPNNITHQELALLYEGRSFDHKKYYGYSRAAYEAAIANIVNLFKTNAANKVRSSEWFDTQLLERYKQKYGGFLTDYYHRFDLINGVKAGIEGLLAEHGFTLAFENKNYPSYKMNSWRDRIIFEKGDERIDFWQTDWRDYTNYYHLCYNDKELCIIDTHKTANVQDIVREIKSSLKFDTNPGI